ncbi:hypothetical protein LO80_01655 [Candidatus Francisella endociliophora]|uniref:Uncharacterized protein n=1 Tax=Candidatus Francisella endociliophora TaxID=653937 RepID=A0A097EML0_9GAMM|nr:hypothetical protein [Francisella sp. FSC1006]AIT08807.1 hypothetical protein LO80_01655 [Francisella sp. FSC1006]
MPVLIKIDSDKFGTITQKTGSKEVAGRNSNTTAPLSEDYCLTFDWGYEFKQPHNDSFGAADHSQASLESEVFVKVPMYHSISALLLNVMAGKDNIKELSVYEVDRAPTGGQNKVNMHASFKDGIVTDLVLEQGDQRDAKEKGRGQLVIRMKFQTIDIDDKVINVSGHLDTTNAS